jgi:hypothetical protein
MLLIHWLPLVEFLFAGLDCFQAFPIDRDRHSEKTSGCEWRFRVRKVTIALRLAIDTVSACRTKWRIVPLNRITARPSIRRCQVKSNEQNWSRLMNATGLRNRAVAKDSLPSFGQLV